jgi:uncharacterized protein YlxW (UPF0749 family)
MHRLGFAAVSALMLVASLIVAVSPTEAKNPQELEADIAKLQAELHAQQAKITSQQAQINQRLANESAMAAMLIQWNRALEAWRGQHFIFVPRYENNVFSFH